MFALSVMAALFVGPQRDDALTTAASVPAPAAATAQVLSPEQVSTIGLGADSLQTRLTPRNAYAEIADIYGPTNWDRPPPKVSATSPQVQPPPLPYLYLGHVDSNGQKFVLLRRDERDLIAQVGEIVDGMYRIEEIRSRSALLTYLPLNVMQIALEPEVSSDAGRPIEITLTAPAQVAHGSTFQILVGVPSGAPVQSAKFRVNYDAESLEVLDISDSTGTGLSVVATDPPSVQLEFESGEGTSGTQPLAVRFLARGGDTPRSAQIAVTADLLDGAGKPLATMPPSSSSVLVVP